MATKKLTVDELITQSIDEMSITNMRRELSERFEYASTDIKAWPEAAVRAMLKTERENVSLKERVLKGGGKERMSTFEKSARDGLKGDSVQAKTIASVIPEILEGIEDGFTIEEKHGSAKLTLSVAIKVIAYLIDNEIDLTCLIERITAIKAKMNE